MLSIQKDVREKAKEPSVLQAQPSKGLESEEETRDTLDELVEAEEEVREEETAEVNEEVTVEVREEETAEVDDEETEVQEQSEDSVEVTVVRKKRALTGAATYRCTFKNEWTIKWPFITVGTTSSYYWCSVCRQENSCAHQGASDVQRHIKSKAHLSKEKALQSTSRIAQFCPPATVSGLTAQEAKVLTWSKHILNNI